MSERVYLLATGGAPSRRLREALHGLRGRVMLALPAALIVSAPAGAGEALAALPGVRHAGEVTLPERTIPRLRLTPDGRWRSVAG